MWDLRPLAIMENKINIKVSLLWTMLLSPKIYSRGPQTSGTFCAHSACWLQASQLALSSPCLPLSMTLPLPLFPNWNLLCFSNTLPGSSCWNVIRVLNCPPTLLLQFKTKNEKQTQPKNKTILPCFPDSIPYTGLSPHFSYWASCLLGPNQWIVADCGTHILLALGSYRMAGCTLLIFCRLLLILPHSKSIEISRARVIAYIQACRLARTFFAHKTY